MCNGLGRFLSAAFMVSSPVLPRATPGVGLAPTSSDCNGVAARHRLQSTQRCLAVIFLRPEVPYLLALGVVRRLETLRLMAEALIVALENLESNPQGLDIIASTLRRHILQLPRRH
mmetsp:Transcript_27300/g.75947  ORF Transcript_27300/g.75947 Transcript_27300/m.75947 type:complete len:116 (+) Transcript_27300:161-508(+)